MTRDEDGLYDRVIDAWGISSVYRVLSEECCELAAESLRQLRDRPDEDALCEEIADVTIMLEQMLRIVGEDRVMAARAKKIERLRQRVTDHEEGRSR